MEEESKFIQLWAYYVRSTAYIFFVIATLLGMVYYLRVFFIRNRTKKYNFIASKEIKILKNVSILFVIGLSLILNSFIESLFVSGDIFEFVMGIFMTSILAIALGYGLSTYFKFYYPVVLENRLAKIRFKPVMSPESGKPMRLLTEDEEDIYLTEEMIAHEEVLAFEYDVWIDDETGHKFIEKYDGHSHYHICESCNFRTLREYNEKLIKSPSANEAGLIKKFYRCSYCNHQQIKEARIAPLEKEIKVLD